MKWLLLLLLSLPCLAMGEREATDVVVDTLRMRLCQTQTYADWDRAYSEWWTIVDLYPYTGYF